MKDKYLIDDVCKLVNTSNQVANYSYIGPLLKLKRKEKGLTLQEVSNQYDINISTISRVENSEIEPVNKKFSPYLNFLDIKLEEVYLEIDNNLVYESIINYSIGISQSFNLKNMTIPTNHYLNELITYVKRVSNKDTTIDSNEIRDLNQMLKGADLTCIQIYLLATASLYYYKNEMIAAAKILNSVRKNRLENDKLNVWLSKIELDLLYCTKNIFLIFDRVNSYQNHLHRYSLDEQYKHTIERYINAVFMNVRDDNLNQFAHGQFNYLVKKLKLVKKILKKEYVDKTAFHGLNDNNDFLPYLLYLDCENECKDILLILTQKQVTISSLFDACIFDYFKAKYIDENLDMFFNQVFNNNHKYSRVYNLSFFLVEKYKLYLKSIEKYKRAYDLINLNHKYHDELDARLMLYHMT